MLYSQEDVRKLGAILGIWAHPDDESWTSAGLMKMATLNGQRVGIITATKGDAGETADPKRWPKANLASVRTKELEDCLCHIGNIEQFWLDYEDAKMEGADAKTAVNEVTRIIELFKPDTVVTFEPNGITGHNDHRTISAWATEAVRQSGLSIRILYSVESEEKFARIGQELDREFNIFFNTEKPFLIAEKDADVLLKLEPNILKCKICCLKAHASQTSKMFEKIKHNESMKILAATECFVCE